MHIGVVYPQTELDADRASVRRYAAGVEQLGYDHVLIYDHVVGADREVYPDWKRNYDVHTTFHEPMVFFGYLAGICDLELVTGVLILPQRQTALVAKQAAEIDLLTDGRFRLGIGVGWNPVEFEALNEEFSTRGRRMDEQVELLRRLWTEQTVTHKGTFDQVTGAGISPMPVQRPIPLWFGATSPAALARVGRSGDGWFPQMGPGADYDAAWAQIARAAVDAGRDPSAIQVEARVSWTGDVDALVAIVEQWRALGASHVSINTMGASLGAGVEDHLDALGKAAAALGVSAT